MNVKDHEIMKTTLKAAFLAKYPRYMNILYMYEQANDCPATWENISKPKLAKFVAYMTERIARTSVKTYCAMFKAVLNLYNDEIELPKGYEAILSVKKDVSENTWLNDFEIKRLIDYHTQNMTERLVRNQFVLGCLTGARHSDYINFTRENITGERLAYVSKKSHTRAEIPLSPVVERIIEDNEANDLTGKEVSDVTFNKTIRVICKNVGIDERVKLYQAGRYIGGEKWAFISSHTARRSFATNLYLRGADLYLISKLMGHSSVSMTEGYIVCGLRELPEKVLQYFQTFK